MKPINRRKALTVVASAPVALAAVPAIAAAGDDAELRQLWEDWKAQHIRCRELYEAEQALCGVMPRGEPYWTLAKVEADIETRGEFCAMFYSPWHGNHSVKLVKFRAKGFEAAQSKARDIQAELAAQSKKETKAAERRCVSRRLPRPTWPREPRNPKSRSR